MGNSNRKVVTRDTTDKRHNSGPNSKGKLNAVGEDELHTPVIASIDFGTTFSGYAFIFKGDETSFYTATGDEREPTCVILNDDTSFNSFGKAAIDTYNDMNTEKQNKVFYFRHFKMLLYEAYTLSRTTKLHDQTGKELEAIVIFERVIQYLKEKVVKHVKQVKYTEHESVLSEKDISWIITIPAIWTDSARQFMREASIGAGIESKHLRLVLEPEAASIYCRERTSKLKQDKTVERFSAGQKYILADLGGGTVDICAHEILPGGKLREIYRATGGYGGGSRVNHEFEQFLIRLLGAPVIDEYRSTYKHLYYDLMNKFETKKKSFVSDTESIILYLDYDLVEKFERNGEKLEDVIQDTRYKDEVLYNTNGRRLELRNVVMKGFFNSSVTVIVDKLREILEACPDEDIPTIFIAGGYSESPYLRERIQNEMGQIKVVNVDEARLAIMKGAVMMGLKPRNIIQRRARFTYGYIVRRPFKVGTHPEHLKASVDGQAICTKLFHKIIEKGQVLEFNQSFEHISYCSFKEPNRKSISVNTQLWRSTRKDPTYCIQEEGCVLVGRIENKPPVNSVWPDMVEFEKRLIVGETEFTVQVFNKTTGEQYEANMDFL